MFDIISFQTVFSFYLYNVHSYFERHIHMNILVIGLYKLLRFWLIFLITFVHNDFVTVDYLLSLKNLFSVWLHLPYIGLHYSWTPVTLKLCKKNNISVGNCHSEYQFQSGRITVFPSSASFLLRKLRKAITVWCQVLPKVFKTFCS